MQIQQPSYSFSLMRHLSSKRTRSPDDADQRPTKRLSLAIGETVQFPNFYNPVASNGGRQTSEDWVQQTNGLTINSPLPVSENTSVSDDDDSMQLDTDEDSTVQRPLLVLRTSYSPPVLSSNHHSTIQDQYIPKISSVTPAAPHDMLPSINVHPPTPDIHPRMHMSLNEKPSTPVQKNSCDTSAMDTSPVASPSQLLLSPASSRKIRFTMGPRVDCEKCRLGVKGHWVHVE